MFLNLALQVFTLHVHLCTCLSRLRERCLEIYENCKTAWFNLPYKPGNSEKLTFISCFTCFSANTVPYILKWPLNTVPISCSEVLCQDVGLMSIGNWSSHLLKGNWANYSKLPTPQPWSGTHFHSHYGTLYFSVVFIYSIFLVHSTEPGTTITAAVTTT